MNPTLVLAVAVGAGLLVPALARVPNALAVVALALALLLSQASAPAPRPGGAPVRALLVLVAVRFVLLPALFFIGARVFVPELAAGIGLLAAVPVGVAAPALVSASGGDPARASTLLAVTTVAFVGVVVLAGDFVAPGFGILTAAGVAALAIGPLIAGAFARRAISTDRRTSMARNIALLLVALSIAVITARSIAVLPAAPGTIALFGGLAFAEFACFYAVAHVLSLLQHEPDPTANAISSGFNNNVLGAALAALYLSPTSVLFLSIANPMCSLAFVLWSAGRRR